MRNDGQITVRSTNLRATAVPIQRAVQSMLDFFDGFEYGETAIVMSREDYRPHYLEFEKSSESPSGLTLMGIPVYLHGIAPSGQVFLTSIDEANRIMFGTEPEDD